MPSTSKQITTKLPFMRHVQKISICWCNKEKQSKCITVIQYKLIVVQLINGSSVFIGETTIYKFPTVVFWQRVSKCFTIAEVVFVLLNIWESITK